MNRLMSEAFTDQQVQCLNPVGVMHYQTLNELIKVIKIHPAARLSRTVRRLSVCSNGGGKIN